MTAIEEVKRAAAEILNVSAAQLEGRSLRHPIVLYRQACMAASVALGESLSNVGRMFGGRDHTTVLNAMRKVEKDRNVRYWSARVFERADAALAREPDWISAVPFKSRRSAP